MNNQTYTVTELAREVGLSPSTVRKMLREKRIPEPERGSWVRLDDKSPKWSDGTSQSSSARTYIDPLTTLQAEGGTSRLYG